MCWSSTIADAGRSFGYPFLHTTVAVTDVHILFHSKLSIDQGIPFLRPFMVFTKASEFLDHGWLAKC